MRRLFLVCIWLVPAAPAFCDTAVQSDWSGDSGVWGPVTSWGSDFHGGLGLWGTSLELGLEQTPYLVSTQADDPAWAIAGDIYTNGFDDIAFINYATDEVLWLKNLGGGQFVGPYPVAENCYWVDRLVLCDLNGDGNNDILGYSGSSNGIRWWENPLSWAEPWQEHIVESSVSPYSVRPFDIDGDGDLDLVRCDVLEDFVWLENSDGSGEYWVTHVIAGSSYRIADSSMNDIDGDGDTDIVAGNFSSSANLYWFENQDGSGTAWVNHWVGNGAYFHRMSTWDPDSDGDMDILCSSSMDWSQVQWWENTGGASWNSHSIFSGSKSTNALIPADLDKDGDTDFVLSRTARPVMWFENTDGAGTMTGFEIDQPFGNPSFCSAADFNQDGYLELLPTVYTFDGIFYCHMGFNGWLESSLLDGRSFDEWGMLNWESVLSPGGTVAFQVRSSSSPDSTWMGEWSQEISEPIDLSGILPQGDRYFQYRAILRTTTLESSPVLNSVSLDYFTGIEQGSEPDGFSMDPTVNPSPGAMTLRIVTGGESPVLISVHDITGRIVKLLTLTDISNGENIASIQELPPGVYMVVAVCGDETATKRVTVIR